MELRRNDLIYNTTGMLTDLCISLYHNINYQGIENLPKTGPALLLPKHQALRDIVVEGYVLNKTVKRPANWVMKYSLPKPLELIGGIRVVRKKDLKDYKAKQKTKNKTKQELKQERKDWKEKAKELNLSSTEYMKWLYGNEEINIVHPEGERNPHKMGYVQDNEFNLALNLLKQAEKEYNITVPIIPVGIHYQSFKFKSRVDVIVGKPLYSNQKDLINIVQKEIANLSGLLK